MGRPKSKTPPAYLRADKGQARCYINRVEYKLGRHGSPESYERYNFLIDCWRRGVTPPKSSQLATAATGAYTGALTINELVIKYLEHCDRYYRKNGQRTQEYPTIAQALNVVTDTYGETPAQDFDNARLADVRERMIVEKSWARTHLNNQLSRIKGMFKWAAEHGLLKQEQYAMLALVRAVAKGRDERVRESPPITTVDDAHVDAIKDYVSRQVWAMIELQRLAGLRPGEVVIMRKGDVRLNDKIDAWVYYPQSIKTEHHEDCRTDVVLGPRAMNIIQGWVESKKDSEYLFSPKEAYAEYRKALKSKFKPKNYYPSELQRRKVRAMLQAKGVEAKLGDMGDFFTVSAYRRTITRAIDRCNRDRKKAAQEKFGVAADAPDENYIEHGVKFVQHWHPNQLRHNAATEIRDRFGLDAAQAVLRHRRADTTEVYAEIQRRKHAEIMRQVG